MFGGRTLSKGNYSRGGCPPQFMGASMHEGKNNKKVAKSGECLFCKMIRGEENCHRLYEDDNTLCILDIGQVITDEQNLVQGRSLVIPKRHANWFYELEDEQAGQLFIAAKKLAGKIKKAFNPDYVVMFIRGQQISHTLLSCSPRIKLIP